MWFAFTAAKLVIAFWDRLGDRLAPPGQPKPVRRRASHRFYGTEA